MRKRKYKTVKAIIFTIVMLFSCLFVDAVPADAKEKTVNITLKYKNKKVILTKYSQNKAGYNSLTYQMHFETVKKKFGFGKTDDNFTYSQGQGSMYAYYIYKTRKDMIYIFPKTGYWGKSPWIDDGRGPHKILNKKFNPAKGTALYIKITSKNFSLNGIRVGMSKKAAEKQLRKYFKYLRVGQDSTEYDKLIKCTRSYIETPTYSFDRGQISLVIKNGKVTEIYFLNDDNGSDSD